MLIKSVILLAFNCDQ